MLFFPKRHQNKSKNDELKNDKKYKQIRIKQLNKKSKSGLSTKIGMQIMQKLYRQKEKLQMRKQLCETQSSNNKKNSENQEDQINMAV